MSEQEKLDIIRVIREELQAHRDYADVKYATNIALTQAKDARDAFCLIREEKLDRKFRPVYGMLGFLILFLVAKYGFEIFNIIPKGM